VEEGTCSNINFDKEKMLENLEEMRNIVNDYHSKPRLKAIKVTREVYSRLRDIYFTEDKELLNDMIRQRDKSLLCDKIEILIDEEAEYPFTPVFTEPK